MVFDTVTFESAVFESDGITMANFSITIPDAQLHRLVAAVAQRRGITASELNAMNVAQKAAMVKQHITTFLIGEVRATEVPAAEQSARDAKNAEIASGITVT